MNSENISLSIITLSYNQGVYLQENIDSIKSVLRVAKDIEHIIIDPGSKDESRSLIDEYSEKHLNIVKVYESDCGPAEGLNKGLRIARGEWIGILNADDYYIDDSMIEFLRRLPKLRKYDIVYGYGFTLQHHTLKRVHVGRLNLRNFALGSQQIFQPSIFFRSELIFRTNIRFNELNRTCWDAEFIFDLMKIGKAKVKRLNLFFSVFRLHPKSISGSQANQYTYMEDIALITLRAKVGRNQKLDEVANAFQQSKLLKYPKKLLILILNQIYSLNLKMNKIRESTTL